MMRKCGYQNKKGKGDSKGDVGSQMDEPRDVSSDVRNPPPNPACLPMGQTFATVESSLRRFERNPPES